MRASLAAIHQQLQQQAQAQAQVVVMAQSVEPPAPKRMATLPRAAPLVPVDMLRADTALSERPLRRDCFP